MGELGCVGAGPPSMPGTRLLGNPLGGRGTRPHSQAKNLDFVRCNMKLCAGCRREFAASRSTAQFCSTACRVSVHRGKRLTPTETGPGRVLSVTPSRPSPHPTGTVSCNAKAPKTPTLHPRLVQDKSYPRMYRIKKKDGTVSDMVSLARAKEALL